MDFSTILPLDIASLPDSSLVDAIPSMPSDAGLPALPDVSLDYQPLVNGDIPPAFDLQTDVGSLPTDWTLQPPDWNQPVVDWNSPLPDWSQPVLPIPDCHETSVMPRSSSDAEFYTKQAETATENVAYHQKLANDYKAEADYYLNHGAPDKAADNLGYAAAEQAKVTSYQQDMQTALDKAKTATNS